MKTRQLLLLAVFLLAGFITNGCGGSDSDGSPYSRAVEFKVGFSTAPRTIHKYKGQEYLSQQITVKMKPTESLEQMKHNVTFLVNRYNLDPTVYTNVEFGHTKDKARLFNLSFGSEKLSSDFIDVLNKEPTVVRAFHVGNVFREIE